MPRQSSPAPTPARRLIRWAAALQLAQGILMEALPFVGLIVILALGVDPEVLGRGFSFVVPFFDDNLSLMMAMSGVFAALRIIAAIGLLTNRMWGYALSVITCCVTLVLMVFMLPAGIADGVLSGGALLLLLLARYGRTPIIE